MRSRSIPLLLAASLVLAAPASAQTSSPPLTQFHYYPYHYFPHSYWPANSPQWPEPKGHPYVRPPAYQAYRRRKGSRISWNMKFACR